MGTSEALRWRQLGASIQHTANSSCLQCWTAETLMHVLPQETIFNKLVQCFFKCHLTAEAQNANSRVHTLL